MSPRVLTLQNRMTLGAILLSAVLLALLALPMFGLRLQRDALRMQDRAAEISRQMMSLERLLTDLGADLSITRAALTAEQLSAWQSRLGEYSTIGETVARLRESLADDPAQAGRLEQLRTQTDAGRWREAAARGAVIDAGLARNAIADARSILHALRDTQQAAQQQQRMRVDRQSAGLVLATVMSCLLLAVFTIIISRRLAQRVSEPLQQMLLAAECLAQGGLAPRVDERATDEIGQLARAFNRMAGSISARERTILARNQELDELREFNLLLRTSRDEREVHLALLQKLRALDLSQAVILHRLAGDTGLRVMDSLKPLRHLGAHDRDTQAKSAAGEVEQTVPLCRVTRAGREHVIDDIQEDLICQGCHFGQMRGSAFCVPFITGGPAIGALHLASSKTEYWTPERQRVVRALADQTALTLDNLRLVKTLDDRTRIDDLTLLYNRRHLDERLREEVSMARRDGFPLSVMMLDIDHFKRLNDTYGHKAGDIVLRECAIAIRNTLRHGEIVARYGGEEFTVILRDNARAAQKVADRLLRTVAALSFPQFDRESQPLRVTVSIGVAEFPLNGQTAEDVLKAADFALYRAKDTGRNCVKLASRSLLAIRGARNGGGASERPGDHGLRIVESGTGTESG
ncbi:MAG: diguanylate cyclase [Blastocatellia bacterium]